MWPNIFGRLIVFEKEAGFSCERREDIFVYFSRIETIFKCTVC
jgi:hypothetical protein